MKKTIVPFLCSVLLAFVINGCKKDVKESASTDEIDATVISQIKAKGFGTNQIQRIEDGYLVEGDIVLHDADLQVASTSPNLLIAGEEQYRTNNLVSTGGGKRNITVSISGNFNATFISAVDAAIARYNAENLLLTFSRVASGGNINIRQVNTRQYIASAGFPSSGNPYNEIKYSKAYADYGLNFMTTVVAHEMGHCIGFRHTDYMDRSYSCGGAYSNEGPSSVGAVLIPGTPSGPDPNSWMLACLSSTTNRPFNKNDKTALSYLY